MLNVVEGKEARGGAASADTHFMGHKFRDLNEFFWKNLEASTVYFSPPHKLNDPFDCQIDLFKAVRLAKGDSAPMTGALATRWKDFVRSVTEPAATCGIFSLCSGDIRGMEERLLWAHYANNHRGVCMTYQIPYAFVDALIGFSPVFYGEDRLLAALRNLELTGRPNFDKYIKPVITSFLTTKAEQWAYEKEARYISFEPGLIEFDRTWLRQICFGLNTSNEDRAAVIAAVKRHGYTNCGFAEIYHSDRGLYEIETREV